MSQESGQHVVIHKKLAQMLLEHATRPVQHFDGGGIAGALGATSNFDAQGPGLTSQNLQPQLTQQYGQQQDVYGQQQNLANTLLQQSQGQGPNVAVNQLNQATGQNVNQQAALAASVRGAASNPALIARQAAQAGAGVQQAAVGQAATLGAQQQLAAQQALAQQQAQMSNQALQAQSILQGAAASQNTANLASQGINANTQSANAQASGSILGGLLGGAGAALGGLKFSKGGEVPKYAVGGQIPTMGIQNYSSAQMPSMALGAGSGANPYTQGMTAFGTFFGKQMDDPYASPIYGSPEAYAKANQQLGTQGGGMNDIVLPANNAMPDRIYSADGGPVPGEAEVSGDSPKNDQVPAMLSPGEIILPRSVTQSSNPEAKAVEFMRSLKSRKQPGYGAVINARKMSKGGKVGC